VSAGNRLYWFLAHIAATGLGIYGAVQFVHWAS
jgi:hypothetical protein